MTPPACRHAGANQIGIGARLSAYQAHITSYDYDCPVGEAGTSGQLGIGGTDKYEAIRQVVLSSTAKASAAAAAQAGAGAVATTRRLAQHLQQAQPAALPAAAAAAAADPPAVPDAPKLAAYGSLSLSQSAEVMQNLAALASPSKAASSQWPLPMEQYGQAFGLVLYSTQLQAGSRGWQQAQQGQQAGKQSDASQHTSSSHNVQGRLGGAQYLDFAAHDYAKVLLNDAVIGSYWRNDPLPVPVPRAQAGQAGPAQLHLLVEAMGRNNFGFGFREYLDPKGLVGNVTLDGQPLANWAVQALELKYSTLAGLAWKDEPASSAAAAAAATSQDAAATAAARVGATGGKSSPTLYRGTFTVPAPADGASFPADTFLLMDGWDKGYVWVNGHNLGRYWQSQGPQRTLYLPGPWLKASEPNEIVVLELSQRPAGALVLQSVAAPVFRLKQH
jgi:hypothetical protein